MDPDSWLVFATLVLRLSAPIPGISPTKRMLQHIANSSGVFVSITADFEPLQEELAFVNYIEGNIIKGLKRVLVDDRSGRMAVDKNTYQQQLEGDHMGICKFRRDASDKSAFKLVCDGMNYLIRQAPKALDKLELEAKRALYSLCPRGFHGYFMAREPTEGTCDWISERQDFQDWLGEGRDNQMLWIQGPPASGKSYLARHIITDLIPSAGQEVAHCFLTDSLPGRGNIEALLRATLYHALRLEPNLVAEFLHPTFLKAQQRPRVRDEEIWTRDILTTLWPDAVAKVVDTRSLTLVVDGFDQMGSECQQDFMDCLAAFEARTTPGNKHKLRVLLLSREYPETADSQPSGLDQFQTYKMTPKDTLPDVARTVMASLRDSDYQNLTGGTDEHLPELCKTIVQGSQGTYLSATMTVEELRRSRENGDVRTTKELLEDLPRDTIGLYDRILKRMHENENSLSLVQQVLRWAVFQKEPLREAEFEIAMAVGMALDQNSKPHITIQELERLLASGIRAMTERYCSQAVEFGSGYLTLVHGDLKESLTSRNGELSSKLSYMDEGPSQAALASVCIAYLTMPYFADSGTPLQPGKVDMWESKVSERIRGHPFVRYAAIFWFKHLEAAGACWQEVNPQIDQGRELLQDGSTEYAKCWTEVWWVFRGAAQEYPGPQSCPGIRPGQAEGPAPQPIVEAPQEAPNASRPVSRQCIMKQTPSELESAEDKAVQSGRRSVKDESRTESRIEDEQSTSEDTEAENVKTVSESIAASDHTEVQQAMPLSVRDSQIEDNRAEPQNNEPNYTKPEVTTPEVTGPNQSNFGTVDLDSRLVKDGPGQDEQIEPDSFGDGSIRNNRVHYDVKTDKSQAEKGSVTGDQIGSNQRDDNQPGLEHTEPRATKPERAEPEHTKPDFGTTEPGRAFSESVRVGKAGLDRIRPRADPREVKRRKSGTEETEPRTEQTTSGKVNKEPTIDDQMATKRVEPEQPEPEQIRSKKTELEETGLGKICLGRTEVEQSGLGNVKSESIRDSHTQENLVEPERTWGEPKSMGPVRFEHQPTSREQMEPRQLEPQQTQSTKTDNRPFLVNPERVEVQPTKNKSTPARAGIESAHVAGAAKKEAVKDDTVVPKKKARSTVKKWRVKVADKIHRIVAGKDSEVPET
ncbi:hypothetical protein DL765_004093 [Monosporascus sp. GIB2]|nr:hypothetical protein DL765_004093 [Monosporascus sp. GIB2]